MKLDWSHWLYTLFKTLIGGVAGAGSAWLGTVVGGQIDSDIHALDLRQMGFVLLSSTLLNLFFFLKQSPLPEDNEPKQNIAPPLSVLLLASLMIGATGCGTVQVKEGSDPVIVHAEWLAENGLNSVDQFLRWERENEAALLKAKPGLNLTANHLRRTFPDQVKSLRIATKRYALDKSNAGQVAALSRAVLDVANQVRSQMGLPPLTLPDAKPSVRDQMKNAPTNAPNLNP